LRSDIVGKEKEVAVLSEHLEMWRQYQKYLPLQKQLEQLKPRKQRQFQEQHQADFILLAAAKKYLNELKKACNKIEPKKWQQDIANLINEKDLQYRQMRKMREKIREVEKQKKLFGQSINSPEKAKERDWEI